MKLEKAKRIIQHSLAKEGKGYIVCFEWKDGHNYKLDHFPDIKNGEEPFWTKDEAWHMASLFARAAKNNVINVYVAKNEELMHYMHNVDKLNSDNSPRPLRRPEDPPFEIPNDCFGLLE